MHRKQRFKSRQVFYWRHAQTRDVCYASIASLHDLNERDLKTGALFVFFSTL